MEGRVANKIITDLHNNINLIQIRYQYKVRKNVHLSDVEFDQFTLDFKERMSVCLIRERILTEYINKKDAENKKVQAGKQPSMESEVDEMFNGLITSIVKTATPQPEEKEVAVPNPG